MPRGTGVKGLQAAVHHGEAADAIVVLGCRTSAGLTRRLERGIRLFEAGAAPLLVLSGGGAGPVAEAETMRQAALALGVPEAALLIEAGSRNTFENAHETARLLGGRGLGSVVLVSDRVHLPRAALLFRFAGLRIAGLAGVAGVKPRSIRREAGLAIHEIAALPRSLYRVLITKMRGGRVSRPRWRHSRSAETVPGSRCR